MSYLVLARKWRPKAFSEVVGQEHVLRALINGLDQDRLHHAFLFSGTRGVGKTTLARIFAKSLNCEQGVSSQPCGQCNSCQEVDAGRFVDLIEVDAASRTKVDDTRDLLDNVQYAPSRGRYKVYLIDEVHMLSASSFNALLKTLEEPPPHVKFLFATTDPQKLPVTILSRCLQFNLRRLDIQQIADHLASILQKEHIDYEHAALINIADAADGSMRDALSLLDQAISYGAGKVDSEQVNQMLGTVSKQQLHQLLGSIISNNADSVIQQCQQLAMQGRDFTVVLNDILRLLQRVATLQLVNNTEDNELGDQTQLAELAKQTSPEMIQLFYQIALHGKRDINYAADPKSGFEMTLLRMLSFTPASTKMASPKEMPAVKKSEAPPGTDRKKMAGHEEPAASTRSQQSPPATTTTPKPTPAHINDSEKNTVSTRLSADNWLTVINSLELTAFTRQLADNSAFISYHNNRVTLAIAAELAHLVTPKAQERLSSVLTKHLGHEIQIEFQHDKTPSQQASSTLAGERAEQAKLDQQKAIKSITDDPAIEAIKQAFDARVMQSTIKPNT